MRKIYETLKKKHNIIIVILLMVIVTVVGSFMHLTNGASKKDTKVQITETKSNNLKSEQTFKNEKDNQKETTAQKGNIEDKKTGNKSNEVKQDTKQAVASNSGKNNLNETKKQSPFSDNASANDNSNLNEQPVQPATSPTGVINDDSNSGEQPTPESNKAGNSVETDGNISELPKEPIWHEPVYEQRWVVDQAAWDETISEPVYSTVERAICNECGVDITANVEGHMLEYMHGWHSEWQQIQSDTNTYTVHHQEVGHYEQILVKEGYWE